MPYHYMVPGYQNGVVNTLRLWSARATHAFDLTIFNTGDYAEAVRAQTFAENITKVLYPEDSTPQGRELRLQQQYFFVACSLKDYLDQTLPRDFDPHRLPEQIIFQLNDTHPVIAIPELMRILLDERGMEWDEAWHITTEVLRLHVSHPAARGVGGVAGRPAGPAAAAAPGDHLPDQRRVPHRACARPTPTTSCGCGGCRSSRTMRCAWPTSRRLRGVKVNGVAELHSRLLRDKVLPDFSQYWPEKFTNVTNGITPRRFMRLANPSLSQVITAAIGVGWVTNLDRLEGLEPFAEEPDFRHQFRRAKEANKTQLRALLKVRDGIDLPQGHMLDVMVKRLHEYKRQMLKVLHIVTLYDAHPLRRAEPQRGHAAHVRLRGESGSWATTWPRRSST